ncbi:hypothetical protein PZB74_00245 [Porifericola rhodea]|uniref:hypothetical protein n=1 Tax=Porifericola rhodea TaxID=930972 RepID=UPI002664F7E4|nr:hypothetical protein [Porifericola rhodea]WKN31787.1 hypothetical protein PZB74_00245 [Porifericola rhodea]
MKKISLFMKDTYIALQNALYTPEILNALSRYGYSEKKIKGAMERLQHVKQVGIARDEASRYARAATRNLQLAKASLKELFQIHIETARLAFKREADYSDDLHICVRIKGGTMEWLAQVERFYANVPIEMMEKYHVPKEELEQVAVMQSRVMELMASQSANKSKEQELTQQRNAEIKALELWMRHFMKIAEVALNDSPQQLEALNKVVR